MKHNDFSHAQRLGEAIIIIAACYIIGFAIYEVVTP